MKSRYTAVVAVIIATVLVVAAYWSQRLDQEELNDVNSIRAAAILNLTGPAARFDAPKQKTLQIAQKRIGELYPNVPLEVRVFDGGSGPEGATIAVRKAREWGAQYYLSGTSPTALAIAAQVRGCEPPVAQLANAANPDFGPPRIGEYRFWPDWKQEADLIAQLLSRENYKRVLLVYSADPYSEALRKELESHPISGGVTFTKLQFDPAATPDFRPALIRAAGDAIQAVVVFGLPPGLTALINQMREVGWSGATVGGVNINLVVDKYREAGLPGPLWLVETEAMTASFAPDSEVAKFRKAYVAAFSETPAFYTLYIADALYFIASGADLYKNRINAPVEALNAVTRFDSASGTIRINSDHTLAFVMRIREASAAAAGE